MNRGAPDPDLDPVALAIAHPAEHGRDQVKRLGVRRRAHLPRAPRVRPIVDEQRKHEAEPVAVERTMRKEVLRFGPRGLAGLDPAGRCCQDGARAGEERGSGRCHLRSSGCTWGWSVLTPSGGRCTASWSLIPAAPPWS